jgi:hypothetical protein
MANDYPNYTVTGDLILNDNHKMNTLKGCPKFVGGTFYCSRISIKDFEGAPEEIGRNMFCIGIPFIESLKGFPKKIGGRLFVSWDFPFTDEQIRAICELDIIRRYEEDDDEWVMGLAAEEGTI